MSTRTSTPFAVSWPPDVLAFAAQRQVSHLLDPLRQALGRLFPAAHSVVARVEEDPEIRGDCHVVFDVRVSPADIPDFAAAKRRWLDELFRLCPAPSVCHFRLTLVRAA